MNDFEQVKGFIKKDKFVSTLFCVTLCNLKYFILSFSCIMCLSLYGQIRIRENPYSLTKIRSENYNHFPDFLLICCLLLEKMYKKGTA